MWPLELHKRGKGGRKGWGITIHKHRFDPQFGCTPLRTLSNIGSVSPSSLGSFRIVENSATENEKYLFSQCEASWFVEVIRRWEWVGVLEKNFSLVGWMRPSSISALLSNLSLSSTLVHHLTCFQEQVGWGAWLAQCDEGAVAELQSNLNWFFS